MSLNLSSWKSSQIITNKSATAERSKLELILVPFRSVNKRTRAALKASVVRAGRAVYPAASSTPRTRSQKDRSNVDVQAA